MVICAVKCLDLDVQIASPGAGKVHTVKVERVGASIDFTGIKKRIKRDIGTRHDPIVAPTYAVLVGMCIWVKDCDFESVEAMVAKIAVAV